jgi:hypothetical protein
MPFCYENDNFLELFRPFWTFFKSYPSRTLCIGIAKDIMLTVFTLTVFTTHVDGVHSDSVHYNDD